MPVNSFVGPILQGRLRVREIELGNSKNVFQSDSFRNLSGATVTMRNLSDSWGIEGTNEFTNTHNYPVVARIPQKMAESLKHAW